MKEYPIMNIITFGLPFKLTNQMYNEHADRLKDAKYLIKTYDHYKSLRRQIKTVDLLLALSIFHKRVISALDGAVKFHGRISRGERADVILMGRYKFTSVEKRKLESILISYGRLLRRMNIPLDTMNYDQTKQFLNKLVQLKVSLNGKKQTNDFGDNIESTTDDLPF